MASPITMSAQGLTVPNDPIIPFIEGDGTGPDIWRASVRVFDAAVQKAYGGKRKIEWKEVLAGEKAFNQTGNWLQITGRAWLIYHVTGSTTSPTPVTRTPRGVMNTCAK